ncbi:MAG TPA: PQQ-binding-like beta-propeller repeat protein [Vicinamibacterales bacterium]|nr:PQQ-binding-like beta-propeller repeat protein [Vicinamibacterales bacterium]
MIGRLRTAVLITPFVLLASPPLAAVDWPGLWGPLRNATTTGELRATRGEVQTLWRATVGGGYAEVSVANGRAVTLAMRDGVDYILAFDAISGRELWAVRIGPTYRGHGGSDDGPISTPAVDGNDLFALGPRGQFIAVDVASGKERWRHDLVTGFSAAAPTWGFAASPLIDGRLVIVPTGGPNSRGLLAFDRTSGKLAWNAAESKVTGYSSAVAATIAGVRQIVSVAADRVFGVNPADGRVLWSAPGPGGTIEVSNSAHVLPGDRLLVSNWEESTLMQVVKNGTGFDAKQVWRSNRLRNANGPIIYRDGHLYGFAGSILVCVNVDSQEIMWRERTGAGTVMMVGSQLVLLGQDSGEMLIADVSPKAVTIRHRVRVLQEGVRAVTGASFANGVFYVRNLREIVALRVL